VSPARRRPRLTHETRVFLLALASGAPAVALALYFVWREPHEQITRVTIALVIGVAWIGGAALVRERFTRPLQTLSNMLAAVREGDYSIRARGADTNSAMGLALWEVNALADLLRGQRLDALEATALLRRVMESIDVAVFAFDEEQRLRLVNRDGEQLLGQTAERTLGLDAAALGLASALEGETPRLVDLALAGRGGRWELRRGAYRQDGRPHQLVVLSDLTRALREEEREAWWRLIRVLSHEINNSLAPIQSLAGSLQTLLRRGGPQAGGDVQQGLEVIESRAQALGRFLHAYAELARLPRPTPGDVDVSQWVRRAVGLETRLAVEIRPGPDVRLWADGDQLDQLLINLLRNAADAALETRGGVRVAWSVADGWLDLAVEDEGPGLADTTNLFVPFFTTKPNGSGIGLTLSRQIAEAHGGTLVLENRPTGRGCVARVRLRVSDAGPRLSV
jgi:PAS domain S-box-containing protein